MKKYLLPFLALNTSVYYIKLSLPLEQQYLWLIEKRYTSLPQLRVNSQSISDKKKVPEEQIQLLGLQPLLNCCIAQHLFLIKMKEAI